MGWNGQIVIARQVVIEGTDAGLFVYDGSGDLIASIAAASGTDQEGHAYTAVASFGNQAGAFVNIDSGGNITVTNAAGKIVLEIIAATGAMLTYSATAGAGLGNLVMSYAPAGNNDRYGNPYPAGTTAFNIANSTWAQLSSGALNFSNGATVSNAVNGVLDIINNGIGIVVNSNTGEIDLNATTVNANGNNVTGLFNNLDPSGLPLSGSATLAAVISAVNSMFSRFQAMKVFQ